MFSGIVEEYAEVVKVVKDQENLHLTLKCSFVDELKIDQSVEVLQVERSRIGLTLAIRN